MICHGIQSKYLVLTSANKPAIVLIEKPNGQTLDFSKIFIFSYVSNFQKHSISFLKVFNEFNEEINSYFVNERIFIRGVFNKFPDLFSYGHLKLS